jgi:hypothetical protein
MKPLICLLYLLFLPSSHFQARPSDREKKEKNFTPTQTIAPAFGASQD